MAKDPTDAHVSGDDDDELNPPSGKEGVQVDLKQDEGGKPASTGAAPSEKGEGATKTPPAQDDRRWKAVENQLAASRRVAEALQRELAQLRGQQHAPAPTAGAPLPSGAQAMPSGTAQETVDKYDQLVAQGKWQDAVRLLSREEAQAERREAEQAEQEQRLLASRLHVLEQSKQKVRDRFPALDEATGDEQAPEAQLYNLAIQQLSREDPEFVRNPYAPEMAMRRMEELAEAQGISLKASTPSQGTARRYGRGQTSMPVSRGSGGATSVTLSREQKEWCDRYLAHLPESERYKHYARYVGKGNQGGAEA